MKPSQARHGALTLVKECLNIRPKENVLIVSDSILSDIAEYLSTITREQEAEAVTIIINPQDVPGVEPPKTVAASMKAADAIFLLTTHSLAHTKARIEAQELGARILSMGGYTWDVFVSDALKTDFLALKPIVENVAQIMTKAKYVKVMTKAGTEFEMRLGDRKAHALHNVCHEPGVLGSPPDVEAYIAPIEDFTEGHVVIDGAINLKDFGLVKEPIKMKIKNGKVIKIKDGKEAKRFEEFLKSFNDPETYRVAELGIGLNPNAKLVGNPLIDEGALGTAHIALGHNYTFGGTIKNAKTHIDCVFKKPTIKFDDVTVIKNGELKI